MSQALATANQTDQRENYCKTTANFSFGGKVLKKLNTQNYFGES